MGQPGHRMKMHLWILRHLFQRLQRFDIARSGVPFKHEHRRTDSTKPRRGRAHGNLRARSRIERQAVAAISSHARNRAKTDNRPELIAHLRREKRHRSAGAMTTEVDALRIDERLFRQEFSRSQDVVYFAVERLFESRVLIPSAK